MPATFIVADKFSPDKAFSQVFFGDDTPLLEVELNEMQKIQNEARLALVRTEMHSGVIDLPSPVFSTTTPNGFVLPGFKAMVNGELIKVENFGGKTDGTNLITLPDPPATGIREDLVFLETWLEEIDFSEVLKKNGNADGALTLTNDLKDSRMTSETSRRVQRKWRIRTVAGVDFASYPEGLGEAGNINTYNYITQAQGGNSSPLNYSDGWTSSTNYYRYGCFANYQLRATMSALGKKVSLDDVGLYIAGLGDAASKTTLQTYDGYSYAIPIARIKRRNSGGYSPSNPGGARGYVYWTATSVNDTVLSLETKQITFISTSGMSAGDIIRRNDNSSLIVKIISVDSSTLATIQNISSSNISFKAWSFSLVSDHPQSLYSNVISEITDLRHITKVQYNYDYELRKASDQFMRGEIGSPKKMMKVYHGIPKSEVDEHTVFYASLDGATVAEVGGAPKSSAHVLGYASMPTGSGAKIEAASSTDLEYSYTPNADVLTIDMYISYDSGLAVRGSTNKYIITLRDTDSNAFLSIGRSNNSDSFGLLFKANVNDQPTYPNISGFDFTKFVNTNLHMRFVITPTVVKVYVNGVYIGNTTINIPLAALSKIALCNHTTTSITRISDIHISNIDRGSIFPNLPPDFISGDAVIMPKPTGQRRIFSQAQMTQTVNGIVKASNTDNSRGIVRGTIATPSVWTAGDTITVTGKAGELISGVFDTDTALARIMQSSTSASKTAIVDDVSKLTVGDTVRVVATSMLSASNEITISSIDPVTKTIIFSTASGWELLAGMFILETTASSSVPIVNFLASGTKTVVAGTWTNLGTNLGTNQATFTLGTNASLTNQDIQIDYSIIMPAGQPALTVPTTTTLQGEAGIRIPSSMQTITSDLAGKVSGSSWVNPNTVKTLSGIVANNPTPSTFVNELETSEYAKLATQDGTVTSFSTSVNGEQACMLLSFDLIKIAERKLGCKIPGRTKADKVAWLKTNLTSISCGTYTFGSSPVGAKASVSIWNPITNAYSPALTNVANSPQKITRLFIDLPTRVDSNGFVHFLCYADPSDGITPSVINVDYASLDIKFADKVLNSYKLSTGSTVHIRDDFAGKTAGDVVGCPNVIKQPLTTSTTLGLPSDTHETTQAGYNAVSNLDNSLYTRTTSEIGAIAQWIFSFNLIRIYEDKYGPIPAIDKVQWLKDNLANITCNWWGYGSGHLGNKATFTVWADTVWSTSIQQLNLTGSVTKLSATTNSSSLRIQSDGSVHFLAYSDAAGLKNLVPQDNANWEQGKLSASTGVNLTSTNRLRTTGFVTVLPNTQYTISCNSNYTVSIHEFKTDGTWISVTTNKTFTTNSNTGKIRIVISRNDDADILPSEITSVQPQLELGPTATAFDTTTVTPSTIYTDYCNIELTLKTPTGYDILVPENPRRDAGMSQILFVRKETKEVQTLAPMDRDLNLVTYSEYLEAPTPISANTDVTILAEIPEFLITDLGSAVGYKQGTHHWMNPAYRVGQDRDELYGELGFSSVPFAPDVIASNLGAKTTIGYDGFRTNVTSQKGLTGIMRPLVVIARFLVLQNGELKLFVIGRYATDGIIRYDSSGNNGILINLQGKPLSKELDGQIRSGWFTPTAWQTSSLVVQGYVDKATGKLITTYV